MTLALLALAVFAGPAQAEGEGPKEYNPKQELFLPESAQPEHRETESKKHTPAPSRNLHSEPTETTAVEETVEPEEPAEESFAPAPGGGGPSGPGPGGRPKPDGTPKSSARIGVGEAVAVGYDHRTPAATIATLASSTGGSSSPLVPVLVAIAILAAISIGAVIYRHRREGGGLGSA